MSSKPIVISVQGGNFSENAVLVSVISDCLRERGFSNISTDAGLPGDARAASEHLLNTQVPHLRRFPILVEGLSDFDFKTNAQEQVSDSPYLFNSLYVNM